MQPQTLAPPVSAGEMIDAVPMPMLLIGADERITRVNSLARAVFGDCEGRHYLIVLRHPEPAAAIEKALSGEPGGALNWRNSGAGRERHYQGRVAALSDGSVSFAFQDVSDVEHAADMRRDFVANVSHELRTPLTALMGFVETLRGAAKDDPAARERFLGIMEREALRMNRLVGELLSLSRVEAEERVRPTAKIEPRTLVVSAMNTLRPMAEAAGVTLESDFAPSVPKIRADFDQMTQVLHNLIENGVKYGGSGGRIRVQLQFLKHDAQLRGPAVSIAVRDFGEGIPAIHLPRLTERFYRVDNHRSREKGGTGLGLAIVKHILNRHRGRLKVESREGEGSSFEIILPAAEE